MGASCVDWKLKKKSPFWSAIFSYSMQQQWTISQSDCDVQPKVDFIQQPAMSSSVAGPRRNSKALPKTTFASKIQSWSLLGGPLLIWFSTDFWISVKPLHLRNTLSNLMRCTKNGNACSQHWSTESPILLHDDTQPHLVQPTLQKLNELCYEVLPHLS